jgi:Dolichyl-phosphate-mannose-protein mannosyltransferase
MAGRHRLLAVVLFAVTMHIVAIARTILPAQDGLKFIRIAREFQTQPWADVIRGSDSHPLYPALVALAEPLVACFHGHGPDAWRIAAQIVAVLASIGLIVPIYGLTRALFDRRIAVLAAALAVLLPRSAEFGHETLSDSLGLMLTFLALWWGAVALRRGDWRIAACAGLTAGFGYLARPEVILVPASIALAGLASLFPLSPFAPRKERAHLRRADSQPEPPPGVFWWSRARAIARTPAIAAVIAGAIAVIGSYAAIKGEISEKLAIRYGVSLGPHTPVVRHSSHQLPRGLDDPRWDFSPKEESDHIPIRNWKHAVLRIVEKWWEALCWFFAVMTVWGLVRQRIVRGLCTERDPDDSATFERRVLITFTAVYALALVRHSTALGYLSNRHVMALVYASLPWSAAGAFVCSRGIAVKLQWNSGLTRMAGAVAASLIVLASIIVQMQPNHKNHVSRMGHWTAGQWLAAHVLKSETVLDTRGWARFFAGVPGYDYWHVRQALSDASLSYIVVGRDEIEANSPRARTLNALLSYAATPLVEFAAPAGDSTGGVRLYRFHRPLSWEGLVP